MHTAQFNFHCFQVMILSVSRIDGSVAVGTAMGNMDGHRNGNVTGDALEILPPNVGDLTEIQYTESEV